MANKNLHPSPEVLSLFHDKEGDSQLLKDLQEHVNSCAECRSRLLVMGKLSDELQELPNIPAPESIMEAVQHVTQRATADTREVEMTAAASQKRSQWPMRIAALFVIGACLGAFWHFEKNSRPEVAKEVAKRDTSNDTSAFEAPQRSGRSTSSAFLDDETYADDSAGAERSPFRKVPKDEDLDVVVKAERNEARIQEDLSKETLAAEAPPEKRRGNAKNRLIGVLQESERRNEEQAARADGEQDVAMAKKKSGSEWSQDDRKAMRMRTAPTADPTTADRDELADEGQSVAAAPTLAAPDAAEGSVAPPAAEEAARKLDLPAGALELEEEDSQTPQPELQEVEKGTAEFTEEERAALVEAERQRAAEEKAELERIAREKAEAERIAREKAEAERIAREKAEAERIAREKAEAERIAREKAEAERLAREQAERERIAREKAERERLAREKIERERRAKEEAARRAREAVEKLMASSNVQAVAKVAEQPAAEETKFMVLYSTPENLEKLEHHLRGWLEPSLLKQVAAYAGSKVPTTTLEGLKELLQEGLRPGEPDAEEPYEQALDLQLSLTEYQVLLRLALNPAGVSVSDLANAREENEKERTPVRIALVE